MSSLKSIREAVATSLAPVIAGTKGRVLPYPMSNFTAPALDIDLDPDEGVVYDFAMAAGGNEIWLRVRGFVSESNDLDAQKQRDLWLDDTGSRSVKAAVEADRSLGGVCDHLQVTRALPRLYDAPAPSTGTYVGAEWTVRVIAPGNT